MPTPQSRRHTMVEVERGTEPVHATDTDQVKGSSWLGRAVNQSTRSSGCCVRFHSELQRRRHEDEDSRLAQLAAAIVVSTQARVFPPNGITVTMIGHSIEITGKFRKGSGNYW